MPLLEQARYKGAYGGRSSGKSHFFGGLTVEDAVRFPGDHGEGLRHVCIREVQKDLKHSAKQLIEDKLLDNGLYDKQGFKVFNDRIQTPGDGIIIFQGMQEHNKESVKSLEKFHRCWVEEAQSLSETSLTMLRPTIRWECKRTGGYSELHFSWNPRRKLDPVDLMFRDGHPPTGTACVNANWSDNPWFTDVMEQERQDCLRDDPDQYPHIWDGDYVQVLKGAYYAKQLMDAKKEGRIGRVTPDPYLPLRAYCDIGGTGKRSDAFVIWICQFVAREVRVLNHYEAVGQEFKDHLAWLRANGYPAGTCDIYLPHDGATNDKVHRVSYESAFQSAGYKVSVNPNQGAGAAMERVRETRKLFPMIYFNESTTKAGREALGWYHEKWDDNRNIGLGPEHDWSSHSADAFGEMCVCYQAPIPGGYRKPKVNTLARQRGRM